MWALTDRGDTTTLPQSAVARLLAHWRAKTRTHDPAAPVDGDLSCGPSTGAAGSCVACVHADPPRPPPLTLLAVTRRRRSLPAAAPAEGAGDTRVKAPFSIGEVVLARDGGHQAGCRARIVDVRERAVVEASNGAQQAAAAAAAAPPATAVEFQFLVHYVGWNVRYDKWMDASQLRRAEEDESDDEEMHLFEVERLVGKRQKLGTTQYRVRCGYPRLPWLLQSHTRP
jgi:hypothetical protein